MAGPMVYAASRMGIPTALMEADAHLGLANRLAAPFAAASSSRSRSRAATGRSTASPADRSRPGTAQPSRAEGRRAFDLPPRARVLLVFGGSLGAASLNDLVVETFGDDGPGRPPSERRARLRATAPADHPRRLQAAAVHRQLRRRTRRGRSRRRPCRRRGVGDRRRREAGDPRSLSPRHGGPPGEERASSSNGQEARSRSRRQSSAASPISRARCWETLIA